jgi:hypothetical protein
MTVQVTGADKRFTDTSGKFYAGMTLEEAGNKKKMISFFNKIDEDKDGVLSYEEMFHDLGRDMGNYRKTKKSGTIWGFVGIGCGVLLKSHYIGLAMAGINTYFAINAQVKMNKAEKKYNEWKKMYDEMEAAQTQEAA